LGSFDLSFASIFGSIGENIVKVGQANANHTVVFVGVVQSEVFLQQFVFLFQLEDVFLSLFVFQFKLENVFLSLFVFQFKLENVFLEGSKVF
jgi:hypothetical protein